METIKIKEDCDVIEYDASPDPVNPLSIKVDEAGTVLNLKTGKEITIADIAKHFNISLKLCIEIAERTAKQYPPA